MARRKLLIGNWKLNHNRPSAAAFVDDLRLEGKLSIDCAVAPVAPMLQWVGELIKNLPMSLAAQNVYFADKGAFTGEWSVAHLQELGVSYCIVGHSERRALFGETDDVVAKKSRACLDSDVKPVICVGESLAEREAGKTEEIIERQVKVVLSCLDNQRAPLIFAYEPIWAIGTGKSATPAQAEAVHQLIRQQTQKILGAGLAQESRILYGGSVNAENIGDIAACANVDGALVGGASLQADSFLSMVKTLQDAR